MFPQNQKNRSRSKKRHRTPNKGLRWRFFVIVTTFQKIEQVVNWIFGHF